MEGQTKPTAKRRGSDRPAPPRTPTSRRGPEFDAETAVTVARVLAPQGLRGEVKVQSLTDFPERFDAGSVLWVGDRPVRVQGSRWQGRALLLKLEGVDDRNAAESLRGQELRAPPVEDLGELTYYRDDLIGLGVVDERGQALGRLADIFSTGSNDVYVVRGARGELLLPATDDVIKNIDLERRMMLVELVEGLEWERTGVKKKAGRGRTPGTPS